MDLGLEKYINPATIEKFIRIVFILIIGLSSIQMIAFMLRRSLRKQLSRQRMMLITRTVTYTGYTGLVLIVTRELNYDLTALFGAVGVMGIVIGVASQTSIGNIISGLFLVGEKSFEIGDVVRIGEKSGTVYSIDLLSIKIKTFDNLLIRIPNQTVISSELTNVTRFPIRRLDFQIGVAYKEDLRKVKSVLENVARNNPLCLEEPEPYILFQSFGDSSINITFGVWFEKTNYTAVKNSVFIEIKEAFDREGIEIPFPHVSIYAGEASKPISVKLNEVR
ncbi:potassium efflux system KefA protein [Aquipluma nitroreducens]|uniref:Potassium efflux system KefA protein n=1 Tax=Aquipluma nitroreducens TaxID=2010828 RepID=A0A5K7S5U4_9BACT|nr:mechanosensitive ion channel family protein [Aquipluma nitroreducens]BBE16928.1 potassium efflux system KefA protein [Aquipluma nitroreducens]